MNQARYLKVEKTVRYYTSGPINAHYEGICFCLHGYGQLAQFFINKFKQTALANILFVAPEGFHRFYLNNNKGRVGASWMTKEDRLHDIQDYCSFLDAVYTDVQKHFINPLPAGVLGFSQGVATACRWVATTKIKFQYLINWAGAFPPDLDFEKAHQALQPMHLVLVVGNQDEYISKQATQEHLTFLRQKGFNPNIMAFEGKHDVYAQPLLNIFNTHLGLN